MNLNNIVLQIIVFAGKPALLGLFRNWFDGDPIDAKLTVALLYPSIDTKLEDWAIANGKDLPKTAVTKCKEVCEELAAEWGMALSNVDAGTVND